MESRVNGQKALSSSPHRPLLLSRPTRQGTADPGLGKSIRSSIPDQGSAGQPTASSTCLNGLLSDPSLKGSSARITADVKVCVMFIGSHV